MTVRRATELPRAGEELDERVRQLEEMFRDASWIPYAWRLTRSEGTILNLLSVRRLVSREAIFTALYSDRVDGGPTSFRIIDVFLSKLREKVAGRGIAIENAPGLGWALADESWALVRALRLRPITHREDMLVIRLGASERAQLESLAAATGQSPAGIAESALRYALAKSLPKGSP